MLITKELNSTYAIFVLRKFAFNNNNVHYNSILFYSPATPEYEMLHSQTPNRCINLSANNLDTFNKLEKAFNAL